MVPHCKIKERDKIWWSDRQSCSFGALLWRVWLHLRGYIICKRPNIFPNSAWSGSEWLPFRRRSPHTWVTVWTWRSLLWLEPAQDVLVLRCAAVCMSRPQPQAQSVCAATPSSSAGADIWWLPAGISSAENCLHDQEHFPLFTQQAKSCCNL